MSRRRLRICGTVAVIAAGSTLSACGAGQRQDASEPNHTYAVQVTTAAFPSSQTLSEHSHLVIAVRNTSNRTIPNVAVTITDPKRGTSVQAFAQYLNMPGLANHSRPVWVVDRPPEQSGSGCGYSCQNGGPGGAVTAYANTWALGRLKPGATAKFDWALTAVAPGTHVIQYEVAAGLNGKARARLSGGRIPKGTFTVTIAAKPQQAFVDSSGKIVGTQ